jgi:hypothetical protein
MPFKSQAQRRKFAEMMVKGEISPETFEEWSRETGSARLPERVGGRRAKKTASKRGRKAGAKKATKRGRKASAKKASARKTAKRAPRRAATNSGTRRR